MEFLSASLQSRDASPGLVGQLCLDRAKGVHLRHLELGFNPSSFNLSLQLGTFPTCSACEAIQLHIYEIGCSGSSTCAWKR